MHFVSIFDDPYSHIILRSTKFRIMARFSRATVNLHGSRISSHHRDDSPYYVHCLTRHRVQCTTRELSTMIARNFLLKREWFLLTGRLGSEEIDFWTGNEKGLQFKGNYAVLLYNWTCLTRNRCPTRHWRWLFIIFYTKLEWLSLTSRLGLEEIDFRIENEWWLHHSAVLWIMFNVSSKVLI